MINDYKPELKLKILKIIYRKFFSSLIIILFLILFFTRGAYSSEDTTIVDRYGQLRVEGNQLVDKNGNAITLRGMSLFWSQWEGARFYNADCIKWLRDDWECSVVRASMGIEGGGYLTDPVEEKNKVIAVIDAAIELGIYVIVDWHDHRAQDHQQQAIDFFVEIAGLYGEYPHIIYEIYNEPLQVSWTDIVKPYSEAVIDTIRKIDPDNIIIAGTPTWSQDVDVASQSPLEYDNIVYALHFYAATHKQSLRNKAITALNNGIALFVSEFGTCESSGTGFLDSAEVDIWLNFLESRKISWCNWSVVDKNETSAALKYNSGASSTGGWQEDLLTRSGSLIRGKIKAYNNPTGTGSLDNKQPLNFKLYQNYPNPFNPFTTIEYELADNGFVKLEIFNIEGCKIKTLDEGYKQAGFHRTVWNGNTDRNYEASSGIYFYSLHFRKSDPLSGYLNKNRPMVLLK